MSYQFGQTSKNRLATVDYKLKSVMRCALRKNIIDMSIICGARSKKEQHDLFHTRKSKVLWPNSKHNTKNPLDLVKAVDVAPYINNKISWEPAHCYVLAGIILAAAAECNVKLRWGGCWSGDPKDIGHQKFEDLVHFELVD